MEMIYYCFQRMSIPNHKTPAQAVFTHISTKFHETGAHFVCIYSTNTVH